MQKTILHISVTLRGPLLTQSSSPGELGLDVVVARNHNGKAYLPGSLISGKVRQSLEELQDTLKEDNDLSWFAPDIHDWLGRTAKNDFAKSKRLYFSDFVLEETDLPALTRYRIKMDPERESVSKHQLVMIESPFMSGEDYCFSGQIHFFSSKVLADTITQHLKAAIAWFSHLGALRSIGFGQVEKAQITRVESCAISPPKAIQQDTIPPRSIKFCIQPTFPFCLAGQPNADNLFESGVIISGAVIKGCLANTWNQLLDQQRGIIDSANDAYKELRENFSLTRFSHAFPAVKENIRPVVAPFSLVKLADDDLLYDVAQLSHPSLINDKAPDFSVDWKDTAETFKGYPWPFVRFKSWGWDSHETELRVHTAIDRENLRSAEKELFAYEQIIPNNKTWYGELDLTKIEEAAIPKVFKQLQSLCTQGLSGLGKTKSPFSIQFSETPDTPITNKPFQMIDNQLLLITLQTDTLLGSPEFLDESSGTEELKTMYTEAWQQLSDGKLQLQRYFARQQLSGGDYRHQTMQKGSNNKYRPWLLTEAGSIFVLQTNENSDSQAIQDMLKIWVSQGLPITESAIEWYSLRGDSGQYWRHTPFVPENGYGEIAINVTAENIVQLKDSDNNVSPIELIKPLTSKDCA